MRGSQTTQSRTNTKSRFRPDFWPEPEVPEPDWFVFEDWLMDSVCECTGACQCTIEHDGVCAMGFPSWLLYKGLI